MRIDLFCQVVDNYGDIGVCWRLARQLSRSIPVRLFVDDLQAFSRIEKAIDPKQSPQRVAHTVIHHWADAEQAQPAPIVIEAFGCDLPERYIHHMPQHTQLWLNVEYLSAESWVEDLHLMPSPQANGISKYFFFPGFTEKTGGLLAPMEGLEIVKAKVSRGVSNSVGVKLMETVGSVDTVEKMSSPDDVGSANQLEIVKPMEEADSISTAESVATKNVAPAPAVGEQQPLPGAKTDASSNFDWQRFGLSIPSHHKVAFVFPYLNAPLETLYEALAQQVQPWTVLLAATAPEPVLSPEQRTRLSIHRLPFIQQADFDALLDAADLNIIRGEDSFVRAIWAAKPFIWQPYIQDEDTHLEKLRAWLARTPFDAATQQLIIDWSTSQLRTEQLQQALQGLNGWQQQCQAYARELAAHDDLVTQLIAFCSQKCQKAVK